MKRAQAGWVSASVRADPTRPRPLLPVLARMSLGLGLALCGAALLWQGSTLRPIPGLVVSRTPFSVPLDGKLPLDLATSAALRFGSDRGSLTLGPLPPGSPDLLSGAAKHRARNPLSLDTRRLGHAVQFGAWLAVANPYERGTVTVSDPQPVQHELTARLSPEVPLTLSTETSVGAQTLDLTGLRLRGVTVRSDRGDLRLRLPGRAEKAGLLGTSIGQAAGQAYRALRRIQHKARLDDAPTQLQDDKQLGDVQVHRDAVLALWNAVFKPASP